MLLLYVSVILINTRIDFTITTATLYTVGVFTSLQFILTGKQVTWKIEPGEAPQGANSRSYIFRASQ